MGAIYQAWLDGRLTNREAVEAIIELDGLDAEAVAVVGEWIDYWSARDE